MVLNNRCLSSTLLVVIAIVISCTSDRRGVTPDPSVFYWPMGIAVDPAGDYVYVVSTNFDAEKTGSIVVPVSVETNEILAESAVEFGSFGGEIVIAARDGIGATGYVTVREGDMLVYFEIDRSSGVPVLRCGPEPEEGSLAQCDPGHLVEPIGAPEDLVGVHDDPFALALGTSHDGNESWLYSGSIIDGTLAVMPLGKDLNPVSGTGIELEPGLHSIVEGPVVDGRRRVFASNRMANALHVLDVWREEGSIRIRVLDALQMPQVAASGNFFRGMALSGDGRTLYSAFQSPPGLVVVDLDDEGDAELRGIIPLGEFPAGVAIVEGNLPGTELVYVTDFMGNAVYCVDPLAMDVADRIHLDSGPYGITVVHNPILHVHRLYVTSFEDARLDVIDVDPASQTFNQVIAALPEDKGQVEP